MNAPAPTRPVPTFRREAVVGALAALVFALAILAVVVTGGSDPDHRAAAAATPSASETAAPSDDAVATSPSVPAATGPSADGNAAPASLPAVGLDQPATSSDGIRAELVALKAVDGSGSGPGNISGPAVQITLRLTNGSTDDVALDFVSVNLTYGADKTPAAPLNDPSTDVFTGTLQPGAAVEAVYVFSVPDDHRDPVTLSVGHRAGTPYLVFSGAAP